jgi:hypothetical protein
VTPELAELQLRVRQQSWIEGWAHEWALDEGQQRWVADLRRLPPMTWAGWKIARQRGKSFAAKVWTFADMGLETFGGVYLAQTQSNALSIVSGFLQRIGPSLPREWDVRLVDGVVRFASGSELGVFGTDNDQFRRRRGNAVRRVLLDEAAFYADLPAVEQVYVPQLQTTGGVGLYLSSPPLTPAHPFNDRCRSAAAAGRYVHDTFWSNPRIDHEAIIRGEMDRRGLTREQLLASTEFRREYLAEDVTEEERAVVPAWTPEAETALVAEWATPEHYDAYEGHDGGITGDPHASLFAVHDPATNALLITDELELRSAVTTFRAWSDDVKALESLRFGTDRWNGTLYGAAEFLESLEHVPEFLRGALTTNAPRQPYLRVGDPAQNICRDMTVDYGLVVLPTQKHEKAMVMDLVNQLIRDRRLRIHTRCKRLREQLYTTLWDPMRRRFERTTKDHGDLLDCLGYIVRNVRWLRDCRPRVREIFPVRRNPSGWEKAFR